MRFARLLLLSLLGVLCFTMSCNRRDEPLSGLWEFSSFGKEAEDSYTDCFLNL